jgi:hypothetical protein
VQDEDGTWAPAAGTFDGWPEQLKDLTTLDPCCGSGHFLVSIFLMLVPMRMERDGLSAQNAVDAVLRENIHGLEIDQRCVELAAFALALTAWKYPGAGGYRALPELNLACSGLSVSAAKEEWKQLGLGKRNLTIALDWMHDTFRDAPVLGSLLNPAKSAAAKIVSWDELSGLLQTALKQEQTDEQRERAVVAQGLAKSADILGSQFCWVATNVPYLARGKQDSRLQNFSELYSNAAKTDLATTFTLRCFELCCDGGSVSIVLPQNWLFLKSYEHFRKDLLTSETWRLIARLGSGAFETINGEVVKAILFSASRASPGGSAGEEPEQDAAERIFWGVDVSEELSAAQKSSELKFAPPVRIVQSRQLLNPDHRIMFKEQDNFDLLSSLASSFLGLGTGGFEQFGRCFWEFSVRPIRWSFLQSSPSGNSHFDGMSLCVSWDQDTNRVFGMDELYRQRIHNQDQSGQQAWGANGVAVALTGALKVSIFQGHQFDKSMAAIIPQNPDDLAAIYCFCKDPEFHKAVRELDQKQIVANATLTKVPFDSTRWVNVAHKSYPRGLPQRFSNDPTQWIFHGQPCGSVVWDEDANWTTEGPLRTDDTVLHVAVARLLGYRWPAELDPQMELADEQRAWVDRCDALLPHVDDDGIVCIPPIRGEAKAEDRLLNLLAAAYGDAWTTSTLPQLLASADHAGKSLGSWLRDKFFAQHCKLFQHRPFIWHIWDGLKDGFAALVNYHKLDRKTLETLIYTYLGDWMKTQRDDIARGVDGAQEKLAAAEALKKKLELILEGDSQHDIFVRWKPLDEQPIGWDPDLNDGVRLNIRPFLTVGDVAKRNAGVLRDKPNVQWNKDRGKDVSSAPWFDTFDGDRINDHHLSLAEKKAAREAAK